MTITYVEPKRVFILGAGVSASCGYPLLKDMLYKIIGYAKKEGKDISKIIEFIKYICPTFNEEDNNYPNMEEFLNLSETMYYLSLSGKPPQQSNKMKLRRHPAFNEEQIEDLINQILQLLTEYFFSICKQPISSHMKHFIESLNDSDDAIITFNYDLSVEKVLKEYNKEWDYSLNETPSYQNGSIILLKPHGSINWKKVNEGKYGKIDVCATEEMIDQKTIPYIIPPITKKERLCKEIELIWNNFLNYLVSAKEIYFYGYSIPEADLYTKFMIKLAIQENYFLSNKNQKVKIIVVNPDEKICSRYTNIIGSKFDFIIKKFESLYYKNN